MGLPRLRPSLPTFDPGQPLVDPAAGPLPYNPTGEFIFPSLLDAAAVMGREAMARWYLYTAPHERPGGITLFVSDELRGPWRQPFDRALVPADWAPHFAVSHVSSPDVVWDPLHGVVRLYFHGENDVTRIAESVDGTNFSYVGEAVSAKAARSAQHASTATEASYARVFPYPGPGPERWGMFFMSNSEDNVRRIEVATSIDGIRWSIRPEPLIVPGPVEGQNVSSADLVLIDGRRHVAYGASVGSILVRPVDRTLRRVGPPKVLYTPSTTGREAGRATAPQLVDADGDLFLFYEMGGRLTATVGITSAGRRHRKR